MEIANSCWIVQRRGRTGSVFLLTELHRLKIYGASSDRMICRPGEQGYIRFDAGENACESEAQCYGTMM